MKKLTKQIIGIVIIFIIINIIFWGAQEFYYRDESSQIKETQKFLESEERSIKALSLKIDEQKNELNQKEIKLNNYESLGYIDKYNNSVDNYNFSLSLYQSNINTYKSKINTYNTKVGEVNNLIEQSGSRWYLLPIPIPRNISRIIK